MNSIQDIYLLWCKYATEDQDVVNELQAMAGDSLLMEDAFYRDLEFGTGGLRGVIGAGTNRINIYTVAKASQGLADYVCKNFEEGSRSIAISYDSRIKSDLFAKVAAGVFAANGIVAHIYSELMPTPCLSYAVRALNCSAGVMVTASHNPSKYNGYKVYGADGCQITTEAAAAILTEIEKLDIFTDVKQIPFKEGKQTGLIHFIPDQVSTDFIEEVRKQSVLAEENAIDKNVKIIYSPLHGTGLKPVLRILRESEYNNVIVVKEQELPDGNFTTCPYPNPEIKEAMMLGMEYAKKYEADLLMATDPDCDRIGIAIKDDSGEYVLLSGNEIGVLLLDYICSERTKNGTMPENPVAIKTIVTTDMGQQIAEHYGVQVINVLTGFKFIGEQIGFLEKKGRRDDYIFGFEESYGYLSGTYVRDKDAVNGAFMICEMFAYYKSKGVSLWQKINELYAQYGYRYNTLYSYEFDGSAGAKRMQGIMDKFRKGLTEFAGKKIVKYLDYSKGLDELPKSDVIKFMLEDQCSVVVRPSGTEPKIKIYLSVCAENKNSAEVIEAELKDCLEGYVLE